MVNDLEGPKTVHKPDRTIKRTRKGVKRAMRSFRAKYARANVEFYDTEKRLADIAECMKSMAAAHGVVAAMGSLCRLDPTLPLEILKRLRSIEHDQEMLVPKRDMAADEIRATYVGIIASEAGLRDLRNCG